MVSANCQLKANPDVSATPSVAAMLLPTVPKEHSLNFAAWGLTRALRQKIAVNF